MNKKCIIEIDKMGGLLLGDGQFAVEGKNKEIIRRKAHDLLCKIAEKNEVLNDTSTDYIPDYKEWTTIKKEREVMYEEIWELYSEYHGIEKEKTIGEMSLEEFVNTLNQHPISQQINFNAQVGQVIAHADNVNINDKKNKE